jgi:hypothetical protein
VLYELRQNIKYRMFAMAARGVSRTPPLRIKPSALKWVSLVCARDFEMYLLAIKSAYLRVGEGEIVCVDDGSLGPHHHAELRYHLGNPRIIPMASVNTGPLPRGGCWERLATCLDLATQSYVIQVDSDTLSVGEMPEVLEAYRCNRAFTQGTDSGESILSFAAAAQRARGEPDDHIQTAAERVLEQIKGAESKLYVRGCAGFAGFPKNDWARAALDDFSCDIERLLGPARWSEWGSEQVGSNFIVANSPEAVVLPSRRYSFHGWSSLEDAVFIHFIGVHRFSNGTYRRTARRIIEELRASRPHHAVAGP